MTFTEKLNQSWATNNSLLCVGLDPYVSKLPKVVLQGVNRKQAVFEFCKAIVDSTHDLVCAFKPQIAYFAAEEAEDQLKEIISYIKSNYPGIPVILDAKRGDIGSTAERYAREVFERYDADAVTVNPYLGADSVRPFTSYKDRGVILLCRTSNPGASDFQDLEVSGQPLYMHVAQTAAEKWNENGNCSLVVGATWPKQMEQIRGIVGDMPFLVPGVGAQGGDVRAMVQAGKTSDGLGLIISSSRAVLYADNSEQFAKGAREIALSTKEQINSCRADA